MGGIVLAYPHPGTVRGEFMASVLGMLAAPGNPVTRVSELSTGPQLSGARIRMCQAMLDGGEDWIWMVDTDIVFSPHTLPALLKAADPQSRPVLSGLYWLDIDGKILPAMYTAVTNKGGEFAFDPITEWEPDALIQVAGVGAGCLLIHRSVLEFMNAQRPDDRGLWFAEMIVGTRNFGEDLSFCWRCLALGIPVHVDTSVRVAHVKTTRLGEVSP